MIRLLRAPRLRDASTNSFSRSESTWPRMTRPMYAQLKKPMMKISRLIRTPTPVMKKMWSTEPRMTRIAIENSSTGNASITSIVRLIRVSTQPPR